MAKIGIDFSPSSREEPSDPVTGGGEDSEPFRAELFSVSQLEQHARYLAGWHEVGPARRAMLDGLLPRLDENERVLREAHTLVTEAVHRGRRITPAAEWFVDNFHLIEEQIRMARRHLPRGYHRELPRLSQPTSAGVPRVYDLVLELVSHAHGRLDLEGLRAFVASYQSVQTLRLGELWAIPIMLRLALLENLRRVVGRVTAGRNERETAGVWVERMIEVAETAPAKVVLVLAEMVEANPPLTNAFVAEFASRLQGLGPALVFPMSWLEQRLAERGHTVEYVFQLVSQSQARDQVSIGNSIGSLRLLGATAWRDFVEAMSAVERELTHDPAQLYGAMDFATRDRYRHVVEAIAKRSASTESEVSSAAVELARAAVNPAGREAHVGYFLVDKGRRQLERAVHMRGSVHALVRRAASRVRFGLYVGGVSVVTGLVLWGVRPSLESAGLAPPARVLACLFVVLAGSQLGVAFVNWAAALLSGPALLPRLDFSTGIPKAYATAVAVPAMLTDAAEVDALLEALEVRFLANRGPHLAFVLLSDFRDAATEHTPSDAALLARARTGVIALNKRYATPEEEPAFYLFHRARRFDVRDGRWLGWERKRGKLEQFNAALRGELQHFHTIEGDPKRLYGVKFVVVLDSDTQLPRDAARELAGCLAHPLNRPRFDGARGRVVAGYAILQPRVAITVQSARRSAFSAIFAGEPGIDPYTRAVSDVYQDVFGEGSFVGKGIYDVDAVREAIGGKLPENRVLSHDLLEGAYARAGFVSDILLFEDTPTSYAVDMSRRHRWMRGDTQIASWLGRRVATGADNTRVHNPISALSKWKILDNLRRCALPAALFAMLLWGWYSPHLAAPATLFVLAVFLLPGVLTASTALSRGSNELSFARHAHEVSAAFSVQLVRDVFALACLPYEALVSMDAVLRSAWRMLVTRRHLLVWRTASDAQRSAPQSLAGTYRIMVFAPVSALATAIVLWLAARAALPVALPVLLSWLSAPAWAFFLSRAAPSKLSHLGVEDRLFLRKIARRTFRFFETYVASLDNHLPPDNFQIDPPQGIAHRTSPTNIGLALTANLAAYDFGYLGASEVEERSALTLSTMERLARYRGHFYNWYDTRSLEPLLPMYISTVDSGNLAGHLLTLAAGLSELGGQPVFQRAIFAGLGDTLSVIAEVAVDEPDVGISADAARLKLNAPPDTLSGVRDLLSTLLPLARAMVRRAEERGERVLLDWTKAFESQVQKARDALFESAPWLLVLQGSEPVGLRLSLSRLDAIPSLRELSCLDQSIVPALDRARTSAGDSHAVFLDELRAAVLLGASRAVARLGALSDLAARATSLAQLDYEFLYDRERRLLAIGYHVTDHRLEAGYYDLLASEARLASFIAIAQGKLPQEHWFSLGRLLTSSGKKPALLSWSGSMFEYLMPLLIMPTYRGTLLDETYRGVVARQIDYGREHDVPWGVSESGYNKTDAQLNYQYRAFGVPGLGFKRGLAEDLVIAPYASAMALMVAPDAACANLRRLAQEGQLGPLGFYEAIDYTKARLPRGKASVTVASYMAHHQGMALLSVAYAVLDQPMQRRFASDPAFRATDLLLQERVPRTPAIYPHPAEVSAAVDALSDVEQNVRVFNTPHTPAPQVQLLSNGNFHVMVSNAGGGYSRFRELALNRWHEDPTRDAWGSFCYLRDLASGSVWSVAHQPTGVRATRYEAIFSQGRAEFRRRDGDIDSHVEISVSPEDDVELRRVSLTNLGKSTRTIELTSFAEVVLATAAADAAHPAFSSLFVQTELLAKQKAILCTRRPRSGDERPPFMFHVMTVQGTTVGTPSYETSRAEFIGRGRSVADPQALTRARLTDSVGAVLDPVMAIRNCVRLAPDQTVRVHIVTGIADGRESALLLVEKYADRHSAERVFELSWTHSQVLLRRLDATEADTQLYERLASHMLYASPALRASHGIIARNQRGQSALWAYAISGDLPIALVRVSDLQYLPLIRQMVQAHAYFRLKGLATDLVIWNEDPSGYRQVLQDEITSVIGALGEGDALDRPGGIFLRRADQISEEDKVLMQTVARVIVVDTDGSLAEQLNRPTLNALAVPAFVPSERRVERPLAADTRVERDDLLAWNGKGGFTPDGREYVVVSARGARTPAPWVNVLANPYFGSVVSESGCAYTWCENARNYRLTPWQNDPVADPSGEAFYVRDEHDGRFWSPTPLPASGQETYTTRHGFGYSVFEYCEDGIGSELSTFVATDAPLKFSVFKIKNNSGRPRRISVTSYNALVMGENRAHNAPHIVSDVDAGSGALFARNAYANEFSRRVAFLDCSEESRTLSADRLELIGRNRNLDRPVCMEKARLSGRVGAALDPCLAMQVMIDLAPGQEREVSFTFGSGIDRDDARALVLRFRGVGLARAELARVWSYWTHTLGAVHVKTPDPTFDVLSNGWLLYQVLAARMWGRSGFYQSGGAYGFRDQLQDAMALLHAAPELLRAQIVRAASRQFLEGDVQHWWHPPEGRGVRTRISDDYLWLPYAVCRYVDAHGDVGVLEERTNYLTGRHVKPDEDSYYDFPARSEEDGTVYQHCVRAIEHGLTFGEHGLPLMGSGDWNDGMNLVGDHGKGESVWLAFFLHDVLVRFAPVALGRDDPAFAARCLSTAETLRAHIEAHGWDGAWYRRAYFDSGEPLGSKLNVDCQIDSLPQSWAVLTGIAPKERAQLALSSLDARLVRRDLGLIQLFDPPFDRSEANPGYVKGYVPGVRENGGQYTHAAVWAVMAFAAAGDVARAWELFHLINPVRHGDSEAAIARYKVEPYVVAADVYTNVQHEGRGGWTWYTGSAAWMYRLALESLLGLRLAVDRLYIEPLLPAGWEGFELHYRYRETTYHIHVRGPAAGGRGAVRVVLDGEDQAERTIPLRDDRQDHHAEVWVGALPDAA